MTATDPPADPPFTPPPSDAPQRRLDPRLGDGWWLWLPIAVFLVILFLGPYLEGALGEFGAYVAAYVARTIVVGGLLVWLWRRIMHDVAWTHLGLGVIVGVVGLVQWVGMDKLLLLGQDAAGEGPLKWFFWLAGTMDPAEDGYDLFDRITNPLLLIAFVAVRLLGPVLVVPVMEEVFWRNWLWRQWISPNDYRLARVGEPDTAAILVTSLAFATVHPQRLVAFVWALLIVWLLVRTRSLGAVIVAHAVTNLLLGVYVLLAEPVFGLENEWYFW